MEYVHKEPQITILVSKIRTQKGLSKKRLSVISGVARSSITEIETSNRIPSVLTMARIAMALQCKIDDLVLVNNPGGMQ